MSIKNNLLMNTKTILSVGILTLFFAIGVVFAKNIKLSKKVGNVVGTKGTKISYSGYHITAIEWGVSMTWMRICDSHYTYGLKAGIEFSDGVVLKPSELHQAETQTPQIFLLYDWIFFKKALAIIFLGEKLTMDDQIFLSNTCDTHSGHFHLLLARPSCCRSHDLS